MVNLLKLAKEEPTAKEFESDRSVSNGGRRQKHADNFNQWPATLKDLKIRQYP